MGTFSIWHWLVVLLVVVLVFGSKKLKQAGPDLGDAIRGFRESMRFGEKKDDDKGENKTAENTAALEASDKTADANAASQPVASENKASS